MKYIKVFDTKNECVSFSESDAMERPCILFAFNDKYVSFNKKIKQELLPFPVYLETEELDTDFRRREADETSVKLVDWYIQNAIEDNQGSYIPSYILEGKIFLDGAEVVSMVYRPQQFTDAIMLTTDPDITYNMNEPYKVLQYKTSQVPKGTIDIIGN